MATFLAEQRVNPNLFVGAASPLWGYYAAAAASGVAWWWMTRWTQVQNLEAAFGMAAKALPRMTTELTAPVADTAEAASGAVEAAVPDLPPQPVGGEAAPISPLVEALAAPEPTLDPGIEPAEGEAAKPRARKAPPPNGADTGP